MTASRKFRTAPADAPQRLDRLVAQRLADIPGVSRVRVQEWIGAGLVLIDGVAVTRPSARPAAGAEVEVLLPRARPHPPPMAQDIPLSILFEDDWLLALDKPPGMVAHPTKGHADGTLVNALLFHLGTSEKQPEGGAGLVSRLDKDTSGVLLVAKAPEVHARLARILRTREAEKEYLAVVYGPVLFPKGRIDRRILRDPREPRRRMTSHSEGKEAATLWERLAESDDGGGIALLRCRLLTGRTHQIRVHLQAEGMPIVGDPLYGEPGWKGLRDPALAAVCRDFPRQALHARRLRFPHPVTGARMEVVAPVPADLAELLRYIEEEP